jgi:hypothetical protein
MPDSTPFAELRLPRPSAVLPTLGYSVVSLFTLLAACNLVFIPHTPVVTTCASALWLLLVSWVVVETIREERGIQQYLVNRLGTYAGRHSVRAAPDDIARTISFGYLMRGRFMSYLVVDVNAISSIDWSSGQATALAGRDMHDWQVALWYYHPAGSSRKPFPGVREEEVYLIGPSGPRDVVEALGKQLVEFLIGVGVECTPGRDGREFNTPARRTTGSPSDPPAPPTRAA